MTWVNGDVYDGNWVYDKKEGQGKLTFNNGDFYDGDWKDDQFHGQGQFSYTQKKLAYKGQFERNLRHGFGLFTISENLVYLGNWKFDVQHGSGKIFEVINSQNSILLDGEWENGNFKDENQLMRLRLSKPDFSQSPPTPGNVLRLLGSDKLGTGIAVQPKNHEANHQDQKYREIQESLQTTSVDDSAREPLSENLEQTKAYQKIDHHKEVNLIPNFQPDSNDKVGSSSIFSAFGDAYDQTLE